MRALTYVILGLLAAAGHAADCGITVPEGSCLPDYFPVYSVSPFSPEFQCIKLDKRTGPVTYSQAKTLCESDNGGKLAEPVGYLHQAIYELIKCNSYEHEAFWIGGKDEDHEDYWEWESGDEMPRGTPHWYPCEPSQPLISDTNANHACMWEPDFYFFSCTEGIKILAMCQTGPQPIDGR